MFHFGGKKARAQLQRAAGSAMVESLEGRRLLSTYAAFTDGDGDRVAVRIANGGTMETIVQPTRNIELHNTTVNSVLTITVTRGAHGDGLVRLGEIRCYGPMRTIYGPQADISREISINDLNQPVSAANKVAVTLGVLRGLAVYTGGQRISTLTLADWGMQATGQELNTPSVDRFVITGRKDVLGTTANEYLPGDSAEVMYLGSSTTPSSSLVLGSLSVAGTLGQIQTRGRIGNITARAIHGPLQAAAFGSITTRSVTGQIRATGASGLATSIASLQVNGPATSFSLLTDRGNIGPVVVRGRMISTLIDSAGSLQSLTVGRSVGASRVQTRNQLGSMTVGSLSSTDVQVGVAPSFTGLATTASSFINPSAKLGNFVVTGVAGLPVTQSWISSSNTISAPHIGTMTLRNLDASSSLQIYVDDLSSPAKVTYFSAARPSSNFVWQPGNRLPSLLAAMLHRV